MTNTQCGCCPECRASLPDHWMSDLWRYCPHNMVMSKRRRRNDAWTLVRNVKPRDAWHHVTTAIERMQGWARQHGMDWQQADSMLTRYRPHDPDAQ